MSTHTATLHPTDAPADWGERTLIARTMLMAIQDLRDQHGENWTDHLSFHGTPAELLTRIAEELNDAGCGVTREVAAWRDAVQSKQGEEIPQ